MKRTRFAGLRVMSAIARFNLTTVSYNGKLECGLFVDPVAVERPADLRQAMVDAYERLLDAAT